MANKNALRVRKVDQVIAELQAKMGVSKRAPKNTKHLDRRLRRSARRAPVFARLV